MFEFFGLAREGLTMSTELPGYYKTALATLVPIIVSRNQPEFLQVSGIPIGRTLDQLMEKEQLSYRDAEQVVDELQRVSLVKVDKHGFLKLTKAGEELVHRLFSEQLSAPSKIEPFPGEYLPN